MSNNRHPPLQQQQSTELWHPGTEVLAMYSFKGKSDEDLSFSRKDILTILRATKDPMWYWAKDKHNKEGMIPANYVQKRGEVRLAVMPWFHGKIPREQAEVLLHPRETGLFLVRESTNYPGDYTLCVVADGKVEHYHIAYKEGKLSIDDEEFFDNLVALVEHYEQDSDGLCTKLVKPVQKKGQLDFTVDKDELIRQGWSIKLRDLKIGEIIGRGDFGEVAKGSYNGEVVAVKTLKNKQAAQEFLAEASLMTALKHPHLVQLIGVVLGETTHIVTEFMALGNLVDYLRSRGRTVVTTKDQIRFAKDSCSGMAYLETKHMVHRDLAARNILLSSDEVAKVSDFGLALNQDMHQDGGKFPIKWTAPEALRDSSKFTSKSDMWSFGILLWEIYAFGRVPYPRIPVTDVVSHVEKGYRMDPPDNCPPELYDIMKQAWNIEAQKRPSFPDVLKKLLKIEPGM